MSSLRLSSISERLSSLFLTPEPEEREQQGGSARRGSYLEYDMEGVEQENATVEENLKNPKNDESMQNAFIDSFPILNTPMPLPPIQPKAAPSPPTVPPYCAPPSNLLKAHTKPSSLPGQTEGSVYDNLDSSNPNWLPGLPLPPPGVLVSPPRNRSKVARLRYLSQLNRSCTANNKYGIITNNLIFQLQQLNTLLIIITTPHNIFYHIVNSYCNFVFKYIFM